MVWKPWPGPPKRRRYRIVHEPYLVEWLMRTYPPGTWRVNVRLGAVAPELEELAVTPEEKRALHLWRPQADAVVVLPDKVVIVEAYIRAEVKKLAQLKLYERALKVTEEFREQWHKPTELILLAAIWDPTVIRMCEEYGIRYVFYRPQWIERYIETLPGRFRRGQWELLRL